MCSDLSPGGTIETLQTALAFAKATLETKALNPLLLDVSGLASYSDYLLVVTARSKPHVEAIAKQCLDRAKAEGIEVLSLEGLKSARWVLMDFGDVVIHIFQPDERGYYDLDTLWVEAPRVEIPDSEDAMTDTTALFAG